MVVGSGCSGLCAANVAAAEGAQKVVVLEKTDQIGGVTTLSWAHSHNGIPSWKSNRERIKGVHFLTHTF